MTACAIIDQARADGLELRANGEKLKLSGTAEVVERWKPRLIARKAEIMAALSAPRSTWWLVHYLDCAPIEVWTSPPATQAEVLENRPDAIAAEPFEYKPKSSITADNAQLEREPAQASCPAWLANLPGDLDVHVRTMAERWKHSDDDLVTALAGARSDPADWNKVLKADEIEGEK